MAYFESKRIITAYQNKEGSIESLIAKSQFKHKNLLKCLIIRTLQHKKLLEKIIKKSKLLEKEQFLGDTLAQLLVYDVLFGIGVRGKFKGLVKRNYDELNNVLNEIMSKKQVKTKEELLKLYDEKANNQDLVSKPKYIFLNQLGKNKKELTKQLKEDSFVKVKEYENLKEAISKLNEVEFLKDDIIKNLLIFASQSAINHEYNLFKEGHLLQIDKSSCMAPYALSPPENSYVIDACAAPGNKTIILANLIKNNGLIYAFDINEDRVNQMRNNLKQHHVKCVRLKCQDFLSIDPNEYEKVEYILLDPSCSGSGMINRYKYGTIEEENKKDKKRLWYLEALQRKMLKHAMSFPNVKRIVYSTCSIHEEENENVVLYGLKHCKNRFGLVNIYPEWPNRGHKITEKSKLSKKEFNLDYCVRTDIKDNLTNGFFIACFEILQKDEIENEEDFVEEQDQNNGNEMENLAEEKNEDTKKAKKRKITEIE